MCTRDIPNQSNVKVVKGGDLKSKGQEFEYQHHIQDGNFPHYFFVKFVLVFNLKD